ncbi:MAG: DUF1015 family protein, partial [Candidatus Limnocylindrales bacterium]
MPEVRPFRALRYEPEIVGDLAAVISPPYDLITPADAAQLLARHARNAVRLDLPLDEQGDGPDDRYRRAARTFAAWRSDGTLRKDPRPSLYVYEADRESNGPVERTQRGFFGRLRLEPLGPDSGVLSEEPPASAPRDDRYKLLRATGVNTSPVVVVFNDPGGEAHRILEAAARPNPIVDVRDGQGVRHRMWPLAADGPDAAAVAGLIAVVASAPVGLVDGRRRYESALRYRDERRMSRSC